jgi:hypothetical protein
MDKWQFNLASMNYTATGTYTVSMKSGDTSELTFSLLTGPVKSREIWQNNTI